MKTSEFRKNEIIEMNIDLYKVADTILNNIEFHTKQSQNQSLDYETRSLNAYLANYLKSLIKVNNETN